MKLNSISVKLCRIVGVTITKTLRQRLFYPVFDSASRVLHILTLTTKCRILFKFFKNRVQ
jgi:hypothetical protein